MLLAGEVSVEDGLLGESLAARHAVRPDRDEQLAALALIALNLGSVLCRVAVPIRRAGIGAALLAAAARHLATLGPVGLVAVAATAEQRQEHLHGEASEAVEQIAGAQHPLAGHQALHGPRQALRVFDARLQQCGIAGGLEQPCPARRKANDQHGARARFLRFAHTIALRIPEG